VIMILSLNANVKFNGNETIVLQDGVIYGYKR
jgi:hypothetical protein